MTKTIKLSQETYDALEELRTKKETKGEAVMRLITVFKQLEQMSAALGPAHQLKSDSPPGREG